MKVIADEIRNQMANASWIRKMFEKGLELKKKYGADKVYDFSLGNPDIPPPARIEEVVKSLAKSTAEPLGLGYCPNAGLPAFREALAGMLTKQQSTQVDPRHIVVTVGAAGALTSFFRAVLEPGDEVLCPAPYFVEYGSYCGHFGGKLRTVPAKQPDFQLDVDALAGAITPKTRVIIINTPNNPTGCVYSQQTMEQLAALIDHANETRERPLYLLSDEPYRFLTYDGVTVPPVLPLTKWAVVLGSFSKSLSLAGERVGYVCANPAMPDVELLVAATIMTNRTLGFVNAPVLGQKIAMALINEGVDRSVYDARRKAMAKVLDDAGIKYSMPKGAFYFFPEAPGGDDQAFVNALLAQNVLAVPGAGFGYPGHVRLSFSVDEKIINAAATGFKKAAEALRQ